MSNSKYEERLYNREALMMDVTEDLLFEMENSGYLDKLSAGIVITGGGSLLKHLPQLVKYKTGLDVRVGFPNEYLSGEYDDTINHPMYATSVGLVLKGFENIEQKNKKYDVNKEEEFEEIVLEANNKNKEKTKPKIIEVLKRTLNDMFEENDAKLN